MRRLIAAISLASLIMFPIHLAADTIVLKSGREIDAVKCRELGDQIKCQLRGGVWEHLNLVRLCSFIGMFAKTAT